MCWETLCSLIGVNVRLDAKVLCRTRSQRREKPMTGARPFNARAAIGIPLLAALALTVAAPALRAQEAVDPEAGQRLAETWCSNCHVVSPEQQRGSANGAPTFRAISEAKDTTELGLHAFLQTQHGRMPDLHLSREEIADLAGYIISLRRQAEP
jgi:mono/diheme cytochrome c family protein